MAGNDGDRHCRLVCGLHARTAPTPGVLAIYYEQRALGNVGSARARICTDRAASVPRDLNIRGLMKWEKSAPSRENDPV